MYKFLEELYFHDKMEMRWIVGLGGGELEELYFQVTYMFTSNKVLSLCKFLMGVNKIVLGNMV